MNLFIARCIAKAGNVVFSKKNYQLMAVSNIAPPSRLNLLILAIQALMEEGVTPYFIQIGASDGMTNDPLRAAVMRFKLPGLLVEPEPYSFSELRRNYADFENVAVESCAVGPQRGELTLYRYAGKDDESCLKRQLTSTRKEHIHRHGVPEGEVEAIAVPCLTFADLVQKHKIPRVDVLQVDVEGNDDVVVSAALSLDPLPRAIHFEHIHIPQARKDALLHKLHDLGYEFAHTGMDTLAFRGEQIPTTGVAASC